MTDRTVDLHPNAPREPSRFAFLIGSWRCGYAITDEIKMTSASGDLLALKYEFPGLRSCQADMEPQVAERAYRNLAHTLTSATDTSISSTRFTWSGERSDDGKTWT